MRTRDLFEAVDAGLKSAGSILRFGCEEIDAVEQFRIQLERFRFI